MELEGLHLVNLKYSLFLKRRFLPIFLATFLGAFNDNVLRSGLVVLIAYSARKGIVLPTQPEILVTICSALLVIPILLLSSIAGPLADKFEKSRLVIYAKFAELCIMAVVFYGFDTQNIYLLMFMLFISGAHTTFYSPIKFSILPEHLSSRELLAGNGFMAGGSYLAILLGMVTGGLTVEMTGNIIGYTALGVAVIGFIASLYVPLSTPAHPQMQLHYNIWKGSRAMLAYAFKGRMLRNAILGLSWFLLVGSVYMSQFANYAQGVVRANNEVYILFLALFSIGIAIGSLLCDTLLKGEVSPKLTPWAALGVSFFTYTMVFTTPVPTHSELLNVSEFIAAPQHWLVLGSMLMVAVCGGIYIVPLYAMLQSDTDPQYRSRVMAASNLSDALFMTLVALLCAGLLSLGVGILHLFLLVATLNLGVVYYARKIIA